MTGHVLAHTNIPRVGCPMETEYGTGLAIYYCGSKVHTGESMCREHQHEYGSVRPYPIAIAAIMDVIFTGGEHDQLIEADDLALAFREFYYADHDAVCRADDEGSDEYTMGATILVRSVRDGRLTWEDVIFGYRVASRYLRIVEMLHPDQD